MKNTAIELHTISATGDLRILLFYLTFAAINCHGVLYEKTMFTSEKNIISTENIMRQLTNCVVFSVKCS